MTKRKTCGVVCLLMAAFAAPAALLAQGSGSSLSGLITDMSQAAVPGADVRIRHLATNITSQTVSDTAGYYRFPSLPVGEYELTIQHAGFADAKQQIRIDTAHETRQDVALALAGTQQTVTVISDAVSDLSLGDAMIGSTFDTTTVEQTPLYLRNWDDLLRLAPGVEMSPYTAQSGATSAGRTGDFNVHGIHSLENNFILDGIDNNSMSENVQELSDSTSRPSVDTISEFRIITNPYSAEFGRAPGAAVSVVTKGGTNRMHGLLFEYLRNRDLDANDFFSDEGGLPKPEDVQNQFGGNIGGPIVKNKLFWFFDYEGTRIQTAITRIATVPLPNERIGDFSPAESAALGIPYPTIYDPLTGAPFPNNSIPASRIDPYMTKIMNLFPLPIFRASTTITRATPAPMTTTTITTGVRIGTPAQTTWCFCVTRTRTAPGLFQASSAALPTARRRRPGDGRSCCPTARCSGIRTFSLPRSPTSFALASSATTHTHSRIPSD